MKKQWMFFMAAMTALCVTACGNGDGIVINGTTAAEAGSGSGEPADSAAQETGTGTRIEIITDETSLAEETAPESQENYSQPSSQPETTAYVPETAATAAPTTAAPTTAAGTRVSETTAARTYKVTDTKKTMYATASVRVRSGYSTSSDVLAALAEGEKVEVTGESENGWMRVNYKGSVGYVAKSYLTETVPSTSAHTSSSGQTAGGTGSGNTHGSSGGSGQGTSPGTGTTAGNTGGNSAGNTGGNAAGPSGAGGNTTSGGKTGPGAGGSSGSSLTAGTTTGPSVNSGSTSNQGKTPGGNTSAAGSAPGGNTSAPSGASSGGSSSGSGSSGGNTSGGNSVTGSVTALNPSGVTIQTSDGVSYQFVWGDNNPDLEPGERIQIYYETTGSGERRVTGYSK